MRILPFSPLTPRFSSHRSFSHCNYEKPAFFRFGYLGAFLIGGLFAFGLRDDHLSIGQSIRDVRQEMRDIATKQQNDHARIISLLEKRK